MFGKKKPKVVEPVVEVPDLEVAPIQEEVVEVEQPVAKPAMVQKVPTKQEPKPEPQKVEPIPSQAQIVSGEMLESGLHRYVVVSNKAIGEVGEIIPLD